jgi:predicted Zn-dependent peptidase
MRGAGSRDSEALLDALDALGVHHHHSARSRHVVFSAVQLGRNLCDVLEIYADIILRPRFEDETFEPARSLILQDRRSYADQPAREANMLLREKFYPWPLGRCSLGQEKTLQKLTASDVRDHLAGGFPSHGAILAVAGNVDPDQLERTVGDLFGEWDSPALTPAPPEPPPGGATHIRRDTAQTHLAIAQASVPLAHQQYYPARLAETVLSGGMSGRLFTEVREKRGLAYHVSTQYHSLLEHAGLFTYAGTRPELAQETFDVTIGELRKLADGVTEEEITRARTQMKSSLVMQGESTSARANALVSDWYYLGKLRSLDDVAAAVDAVSGDDVVQYAREYPPGELTILVIGPEPVETPRPEDV